jgi:hypothetical protein
MFLYPETHSDVYEKQSFFACRLVPYPVVAKQYVCLVVGVIVVSTE